MTPPRAGSTANAERRGTAVRLVAAHAQAEHRAQERPLNARLLGETLRRRLPRVLAVAVSVEPEGPFLRVLIAGRALACLEADGQLATVVDAAVPRGAPAFGTPAFAAGHARFRRAVAVLAVGRRRALGSRGRCGARARAPRAKSRARRTAGASRAGPDGPPGGEDGPESSGGRREALTGRRAAARRA